MHLTELMMGNRVIDGMVYGMLIFSCQAVCSSQEESRTDYGYQGTKEI
ncbi:hypothetical protein [Brevibacillus choshinensis]|uniref:Uncharacterized protein n=1 Tax=Brevibacillus choshinensis TaxID=54911 RepID=A0ABX7FKQ7_BRECH|nr:hypothetical protein [Brevibacillus choshinensis]QRG65901.1 hypothetical protein JNE38_20265 [Brevibacillus choshinensis]